MLYEFVGIAGNLRPEFSFFALCRSRTFQDAAIWQTRYVPLLVGRRRLAAIVTLVALWPLIRAIVAVMSRPGVIVPLVIALKMLFIGGTMTVSSRCSLPPIVVRSGFPASIRCSMLIIVSLVGWSVPIVGTIARCSALISILVKRRL